MRNDAARRWITWLKLRILRVRSFLSWAYMVPGSSRCSGHSPAAPAKQQRRRNRASPSDPGGPAIGLSQSVQAKPSDCVLLSRNRPATHVFVTSLLAARP